MLPMKSTSSPTIHGLVVFACNLLGDSICRLPAIKAAKETHPSSRLLVVVDPRYREVFEGQPFIDEIYLLDRRGSQMKQFIAWLKLLRWMRKAKPDLVLDLYGSKRTKLVARLSGAKTRVALSSSSRGHIIEQINEVVKAAGIAAPFAYVSLAIGESDRQAAQNVLSEAGLDENKLVLLNPSARVEAKRWRAERFGELARRLAEEGMKCAVIAAPGEETITQEVLSSAQGKAIALPVMSLKPLAALLLRATVLVTGDTGVLHLAAAMGCPTIILAGPTDPKLVLGDNCQQIALFHRTACSEWISDEQCAVYNECKKRICLDVITVEEVLAAVKRR